MSDDTISAVMGSTRTIRTLVDGGMSVTIDIPPGAMQDAFKLFGTPGTNVAIARVTQVAAQSHTQRAAIKEMASGGHGKSYQVLHRSGWFHNPRVSAAFKATDVAPEQRADFIKAIMYEDFAVTSMADVSPENFREYLKDYGILDTLPAAFGAA